MPINLQRLNQDKEKILSTIRTRGPSLPVHIARALKIEPLFASAFLAELRAEKKLEISNMKVGGSPLYYSQGQELQLERFTEHLNQREKEAFMLLKEKQVLDDETQNPVIRVALRAIKDFAIPIRARVNGEIKTFWKYFTLPEEEVKNLIEQSAPKKEPLPQSLEPPQTPKTEQAGLNAQLEQTAEQPQIKKPKRKQKKTKESFLNDLKPILEKKNLEIIHILEYDNKEVLARVKHKETDRELLLLAINKKKMDEKTIKRAYKKAKPYNLPYTVLALSAPTKSLKEKHGMYSNLLSLEHIE